MLAAQKQQVSLKGALKTLRQRWTRGTYTEFDKLLTRIVNCDLETASRIRQSWEDLDLLGYDSEGFLCWYQGGF